MNDKYTPELGQAVFGQLYKELGVPASVKSALELLREEMVKRKMFIPFHSTPFDNYGHRYKNDVFECNSYDWNEDNEQLYNFKWRDIEICWYKYLGRGMSMNRKTEGKELVIMLQECINSL